MEDWIGLYDNKIKFWDTDHFFLFCLLFLLSLLILFFLHFSLICGYKYII